MRAIEAKTFSGYGALRQAEYPKPRPAREARDRVRHLIGDRPFGKAVLTG
jgi:hypothetical protein